MNEPLAYILRPKSFEEIVGQKHLVGKNGIITKMVRQNHISSMILYGEPGIGKTTIASVICGEMNTTYRFFNASCDKKETLKTYIEKDNAPLLIIDEIHRMKADTQDYLLPFVEKGIVTIIGLTTINPYRAVNPAIRSRAAVYKLNLLSYDDLLELVNKAIKKINEESPLFDIEQKAKDYIINSANGEARILINMIENIYFIEGNKAISINECKEIIQKPNIDYDKNGDDFYNTLSGLHKSIRGSDVDAALHYLAVLIASNDLLPLIRRLECIAYEDISVANPSIGPRVKAACDVALDLGLPEARLPLASIVVDMCLSPKSNSTYLALAKAIEDIENGNTGPLPNHLKNVYDYEDNNGGYKYPHDYPGGWVNQQYLPDKIKDRVYYIPKTTSSYEQTLKERWDAINKARKRKIPFQNIKGE